MADLRALGADTDEQLEALQKAFLESRDAPAAEVRRIGRRNANPETEVATRVPDDASSDKVDDASVAERGEEGAHADGVDGDDDADARERPMRSLMEEVMGDIVERGMGESRGDAAPGSMGEEKKKSRDARSAATGFPEVKHRSETNFGRKSRFAARKAAAREAEAAKSNPGEASTTSGQAGEKASATAAPRTRRVDPKAEDASIQEENDRIIKAMSPAAVKEAQEELASRLSAKTLDFLRNRGASKAREKSSEGESGVKTPAPVASNAPKRPTDRSVAAAEASARTKVVATVGVEHVRFALDGTPLVDASMDVLTLTHADGAAPAPLPTERDPLRAGEGSDIGYTLQEACALTRSSVPSQRVIGLNIIGKILKLARRWSFEPVSALPYETDDSSESSPRLPNGITWASVWVYATVDCGVITLLRRSFDDSQTQPMIAALSAIRTLVGGVGVGGADGRDMYLIDMLESNAPLDPSGLSFFAPLWRAELEDAPCGGAGFEPVAWEYAVEEISLDENSDVRLAEEPDQVEEGLNREMAERRKSTEQAADPIAALLRMGILQRIRYVLEVERSPQGEVYSLELLAAFARHSKGAARAVARCPRLLALLMSRVKDSCSEGSRGTPTEPKTIGVSHAMRVLRLLAQADVDVATDLSKEGFIKSAIQASVTLSGVATANDGTQRESPKGFAALLWRETFRAWAALSASGLNTPAFDAIHPLVAPWLETSTGTEPSIALDIFPLLTTLSTSLPEDEGGENAGPPGELEIADTAQTLSWRCATAAAKCAESWLALRTDDVASLFTMSHAARFLSVLVARSPNDAGALVSKVIGRLDEDAGMMRSALNALDKLVDICGLSSFGDEHVKYAAWGSLLHAMLLVIIVSPEAWSDQGIITLATHIAKRYGARKRSGRMSSDELRTSRSSIDQAASRRSSTDVLMPLNTPVSDFEDPTVWMGEQPIASASRLPVQRAVVVAMEILDKAFTETNTNKSRLGPSTGVDKKELQVEVAKSVDATLSLLATLPPGSGVIASQAISAGLYSPRVLQPLLLMTKKALGDAEQTINDSNEEERARLAIRDAGVNLAAASVTLVAPPEIVRDALLGGFAMELTTSAEAKTISTPSMCTTLGSLLPAHHLWYLAPLSPRTTIQGWGVAGVACTLSLLMGMELAKVSRVREIRPALKMAAIGAVYLQGANVWRDPAVSAPLGLLTDLYWRRMVKNYIQAYHQGVTGYSMDLGHTSAGEGGLNDPLNRAQGTGDASAAAAMVNAFAADSFGDALFARHVSMWLRVRVSPKARAAAWIALSEGIALHLLPCTSAMVPPAAAYVFFPPGGEPDPTMRELYIKSIEEGALDKALSGWSGDEYPTPGNNSPPLSAALAIHALAHIILSPGAGAEAAVRTLRRILDRPNTSVVLRALIHTPLTIKRRPSFACASVGAHKTPFGNGFVYGKRGQDIDIPPRRTLLFDVCGDDRALIQKVENALVNAGLMTRDAVKEAAHKMSNVTLIEEQSSFYK